MIPTDTMQKTIVFILSALMVFPLLDWCFEPVYNTGMNKFTTKLLHFVVADRAADAFVTETSSSTGRAFRNLPVVAAGDVRERLADPPSDWALLDVRGPEEFEADRIAGAEHVYLGELPAKLEQLDAARRYTVMCGSGARATIAVSLLLRAGFPALDLFLGSLGAWKQRGYETDG